MNSQTGSSAGGAGDRPFRSGDSTSRRVMEDVLKSTEAMYSLEQASDPSDLTPLLEVARRFPDAPFELQTVGIELVRATLRRQLKQSLQSDEQLEAIASRVAQTLFENPETHARLSALWSRLIAVK